MGAGERSLTDSFPFWSGGDRQTTGVIGFPSPLVVRRGPSDHESRLPSPLVVRRGPSDHESRLPSPLVVRREPSDHESRLPSPLVSDVDRQTTSLGFLLLIIYFNYLIRGKFPIALEAGGQTEIAMISYKNKDSAIDTASGLPTSINFEPV